MREGVGWYEGVKKGVFVQYEEVEALRRDMETEEVAV